MNQPLRQTKIVCTLGPASFSPRIIQELILAGVNIFRLNFSYGSQKEYKSLVSLIKNKSLAVKIPVAILGDLQGPKIRIGNIQDNFLTLLKNQTLILTSKKLLRLAGD